MLNWSIFNKLKLEHLLRSRLSTEKKEIIHLNKNRFCASWYN